MFKQFIRRVRSTLPEVHTAGITGYVIELADIVSNKFDADRDHLANRLAGINDRINMSNRALDKKASRYELQDLQAEVALLKRVNRV